MIDFFSLVKDTNAYKIVRGEKSKNTLSHAYILVCSDEKCLNNYLKEFAKLLTCEQFDACNTCRVCNLIEKNRHQDIYFYPKTENPVNVEDVAEIINESIIKPIELNKKLFVINFKDNASLSVQNKLLKTLEEPPKNVFFLIGVLSEHALLQTVKSRAKKIEIFPFDKEKLFNALKNELTDEVSLERAISLTDGTVGQTVKLYNDKNFFSTVDLVAETLVNMNSSKNVLEYSTKITKLSQELEDFLSVLELALKDMLVSLEGKENLVQNKELLAKTKKATGFNVASLLYGLEKVEEAKKRKKANATNTMLIEWLLLQILEGKFKWQKL
ncbi:MAG: hypothetical protein IKW33_02455 [Clostridia bacterium]|nr:hypothetical protein [Clostridia bacterium]